jgi:hypothetical protein
LRTDDSAKVKVLQAQIAAHLETVRAALREDTPIKLSHRQPPHSRVSFIAFGQTARARSMARGSPAYPLAGGHERAPDHKHHGDDDPSAIAVHRPQSESPALGATDIDDLNSDFPRQSIMQDGNLDRLADASFLDRFNKIRKTANLPAICLDNDVAYCAG